MLRHTMLGRPAPLLVGWDVTNRCNLSCGYCHRQPLAQQPEMETAAARALLQRLVNAGMRVCVLSGGEPLLREDLPGLTHLLRRSGVFVAMNTNGALLPRSPGVMDDLDLVKISYDGPPAIHDSLRGDGAHQRAMEAVDAARARGLAVKLNCTLTRHNVGHLPQILDFCRRRRLAIKFQPVSGAHDAGHDLSPLAPDEADYQAAIRAIRRDKGRRGSPVVNTHAALDYQATWPRGRPLECVAGEVYCRINTAGQMYTCTMLQFAGEALDLGGDRDLADAMRRGARSGCSACWCSSSMELNLLMHGNLLGALRERHALWRGGG